MNDLPPPPPVAEAGACPAHPFVTDHDNRACRDERLNRAIAGARIALGSGLTDDERSWALAYLHWRFFLDKRIDCLGVPPR